MIHFYTAKKYDFNEVRTLCESKWIDHGPRAPSMRTAVTSPTSVTCPGCLKVLIERWDRQLRMMRDQLAISEAKAEDTALFSCACTWEATHPSLDWTCQHGNVFLGKDHLAEGL